MNLKFPLNILKKKKKPPPLKYKISGKIRPVLAELFRSDMTDMRKLLVAFRNFANAPMKERTPQFSRTDTVELEHISVLYNKYMST